MLHAYACFQPVDHAETLPHSLLKVLIMQWEEAFSFSLKINNIDQTSFAFLLNVTWCDSPQCLSGHDMLLQATEMYSLQIQKCTLASPEAM